MRFPKHLDDFLLAMLAIVLADVVLFHFGGYVPVLQPKSYSGIVEGLTRRFADTLETSPGRHRIVVMGNSKTHASVRERQLEAELAGSGLRYHAINQAVGGSTPRSWYVLLTDGQIARDNTEIVVLGINSGSIAAYGKEKLRDVEISKTRLRILDTLAMASAHRGLENRLEVSAGMIFRTPLFRDDLRQFLAAPGLRIREVADSRARYDKHGRVDNRSGHNLLSARLGKDGKLVFDELDDFLKSKAGLRRRIEELLRKQKKTLEAMAKGRRRVRRSGVDPGKLKLLHRLVEYLNAEDVKVVFSVLPFSPFALNRPLKIDHLGNFFRDLEQRGADVEVWHDRELLRQLQAPAYYQDTLHVNAKGAQIYTRGLARFLASIVGGESKLPKSKLKVQERLDAAGSEQDHRPDGQGQDGGA